MLRKSLLICLLLLILTPIWLLTQVLDHQPLVSQARPPSAVDALRTKELAKRTLWLFQQPERSSLTVSEGDLNAVLAFLARGTSRLAGQFRLTPHGLEGIWSLRLPENPFGTHLNGLISLLPSRQGLQVGQVQLGDVQIPGGLALWLGRGGGDLLIGEQLISQILANIETLQFFPGQMQITFSSGKRLALLGDRLKTQLKNLRDDYARVGDLEAIRYYYQQLVEMGRSNLGREPISMARYLIPLFQLAELRSQTGSPVAQNQAAIFALAIYLGSQQMQKFTGSMSDAEHQFPATRTDNLILAGRKDLRQHFLVSAGLKLLSDTELGFAVGEFKELLDSNQGGSGFSFVDLAADRAGLRFAERATASEKSARELQRKLAVAADEATFFPPLADLEEGLDAQGFSERYQDVQSSAYLDIVALIDRRLDTLPLYR